MPETVLAFDKNHYPDGQDDNQGSSHQDYYLGDYSIEEGSIVDVRADRKAVGSCSIARLRSRTRLFFRRAMSHIRKDGADVVVLWFVKRGRLHISHQSGHSIASAGDLTITRSATPFSIECLTDEESRHEVFHVVLPAHKLRHFLPDDIRTGFCTRAESREFQIAQRILRDLFEDPGELADHSAEMLLNSALALLAEALKGRDPGLVRRTLADRRLDDVLKYIDVHLSDSKLSVARVAEGCGISQRYLSLLLQRNGTSFSSLVWGKRLKVAGSWLAAAKPGRSSISEVAYGVGFKSPAHFSRMFKREFKCSPRQYRKSGLQLMAEPQPVVGNVGQLRH
jgi:AraC-like DNA-binding protein